MAVMDEFRAEREALKNGTPKEKWNYFWDYYKIHVIVIAFAVIMVGTLAYQIITRKETAFFAAMINTVELKEDHSEYTQGFADLAGIDLKENEILLDTTMYIDMDNLNESSTSSMEKFMVYIAAQEMDVTMTEEALIQQYAYNETFGDLRDFLTAEQVEKYEPYFFYMDQAVLDAKNAAYDAGDYEYVLAYPENPREPESMEKPIPVGIYLDEAASLKEHYYFSGESPVICIITNTLRPEESALFIDYIMQ